MPEPLINSSYVPAAVPLFDLMSEEEARGRLHFADLVVQGVVNLQALLRLSPNKRQALQSIGSHPAVEHDFIVLLLNDLRTATDERCKAYVDTVETYLPAIFKTYSEKRALLLFFLLETTIPLVNNITRSMGVTRELIVPYLTLETIIQKGVLRWQDFYSLSRDQQIILMFFLKHGGYQDEKDDAFIKKIYRTLCDPSTQDRIPALLEDCYWLQGQAAAYLIVDLKSLESDSALLDQFIQRVDAIIIKNMRTHVDRILEQLMNIFLTQPYGYANAVIARCPAISINESILLWKSSTINDIKLRSLYYFKVHSINQMIDEAKKGMQGKASQQTSNRALALQIILAQNINFTNTAEIDFMLQKFPQDKERLIIFLIKANLFNPACEYMIAAFDSEPGFLEAIGDLSVSQRNEWITRVILAANDTTQLPDNRPRMDFILGKEMLNYMTAVHFQALFANNTIFSQLITPTYLIKLDNEKIYLLFDHLDKNNQLTPLFLSHLRNCLYKNILVLKNGLSQAENLTVFAQNNQAKKILERQSSSEAGVFYQLARESNKTALVDYAKKFHTPSSMSM